jgi:hypothetical protein
MGHCSRLLDALNKSEARDKELLRSRLPWYYDRGIKIDPPFAHMLDDEEIQACADWFTETTDNPLIGDSGFIAMSIIADLILGNQIQQVVQLGHYAGFGSLIIGMVLRKISPDARLVSFDIDAKMTDFCDRLMARSDLQEVVRHVCMDSTDPATIEVAGGHLNGSPQLIFIDASKQYKNTVTEVSMWTPYITGFVIAHDVSAVAKGDQANGSLGVSDGMIDSGCFLNHDLLLLDPQTEIRPGFPYLDPCGLGIGISRGTKELPRPHGDIGGLIKQRNILESGKLAEAENWFLERPFQFEPGKLMKHKGAAGWATCFAAIEPGQKLRCELQIKADDNSDIMVCAGGLPGTSMIVRGGGSHYGEFEAGADNSLVGIYASEDSEFVLEHIRVYSA